MTIPTINLSLIPTFPARVTGSGPATVTKSGLSYTFGWDITKYGVNPAPGADSISLLGYNATTGATELYSADAQKVILSLGELAYLDHGTGLSIDAGSTPNTLHLSTSGVTAGTYNNTTITVDQYGRITAAGSGTVLGSPQGQCRLVKSGSNIVLQPRNGNVLTINGANQTIPSAGVSLAPTGLTPSTLYYIYAYMNSGTMTLEASTTGHATDTSTGVEIKSGDATRAFVGWARPITGPAFADTATQRLVVSYYNPQSLDLKGAFSADRSTTSTSYAEINSEIRVEFISNGKDAFTGGINGAFYNSGANVTFGAVGFDGTTPEPGVLNTGNSGTVFSPTATRTLSEGYHYATLLGKVSAGTGTWTGTGTNVITTLVGAIKG